jgi:hypothetical protein
MAIRTCGAARGVGNAARRAKARGADPGGRVVPRRSVTRAGDRIARVVPRRTRPVVEVKDFALRGLH